MNKYICLLSAFLFMFQNAFTQKRVNGIVVDENNYPMAFVNVAVFNDSTFIVGASTNETGNFNIEVVNDANCIILSFIGYERKTITINNNNSDLGVIQMNPSLEMLKEVVVKAPLISRQADRIILNISGNRLLQGKNLKEILSMSPGVWASENNLSIYGKTGTAIYIDDRLINLSGAQLIEYIRSLQADEIARIEVIPNAGAEYAANSPGGVIKIYLKKRNIDGLIGNIGTSATYGKDKIWFNPNGYISIHRSKLTYSLYVSSNMSPRNDILTNEKSSNNVSGNQISGNIRNGQKTINANIMLGIYYDMNKKSRFGIEVEHIASNKKDNSTSNSLINNNITEE